MPDGVEHPAQLRGIRALDRVADAAQADRAQRVALARVRAVGGTDLLDQVGAHASTASSDPPSPAPGSAAASASSADAAPSALMVSVAAWPFSCRRPSTASTEDR